MFQNKLTLIGFSNRPTAMAQGQILKIINLEFARLQARNPQYSLRAFSHKVGISASTLSRILAGKQPVTRRMGRRILDSLGTDPELTSRIVHQLKGKYDPRAKESKLSAVLQRGSGVLKYNELTADKFSVISDWHNYAVLSLAEIPGFKMDEAWVAKRLGLKITVARSTLERLKRIKLLVQSGSGDWVSSGVQLTTTADVSDGFIRKAHFQTLELAKLSLERDPVDTRDFSGITMAIDPERLPAAKQMIRDFRRQLCAYLESGNKKKVYRMNVQLFPIYGKSNRNEMEKENE